LFSTFEDDNLSKRDELRSISETLANVGVQVEERGTGSDAGPVEADIIFIDLFFDDQLQAEAAAEDAAEKIAAYLPDPSSTDGVVPLVVLISSREPDLARVNARFRDCALVPGCRFTFMHKRLFRDSVEEALFRLLQLVRHDTQSRQFDLFIRRMGLASTQATQKFLSKLRQFELSDYADLSELIVRAEGIPLRQYLLDLYALAWASFAESSEGIVHALEELDNLELTVDQYPPNAFVPSESVLELYENALYRPGAALGELEGYAGLGLGDILVTTPADGTTPDAYLVIVQDCDMARDEQPDAAFLVRGSVQLAEKARAEQNRFPITLGGQRFSVEWYDKNWRAVRGDEFDTFLADNNLIRAMRLRSPWSLMRQTEFFRRLSRPAAMKSPHEIDAVDIEVLLAGRDNKAYTIRNFCDQAGGFLLHGRDGDDSQTRLVLSQDCAAQLREALRSASADEATYNQGDRQWVSELLSDFERLRLLHTHLKVRLDKSGKEFQDEPLQQVGVVVKEAKFWKEGDNPSGCRLMINARRIIEETQEDTVDSGDDE